MGGLNYEPSQFPAGSAEAHDFDTLAQEVKKILNDEAADDLDAVYRLGGSSGGVRPKAHIRIDGQDWIVKFPCRLDPQNIGEQEYKANAAARECEFRSMSFACFRRGSVRGISGQNGLTGKTAGESMCCRSPRF